MPRDLLVLDLGNVLVRVDWDPFVRDVVARIPGIDPAAVRSFLQGDEKMELDRGALSPLGFLSALAGRLGAGDPPGVAQDLLGPWTGVFSGMPGASEAVLHFRADQELWMLSDTDPSHFARVLDDWPFLRVFDRYLLSFELGRVKTDPGAFDAIAAEQARGRRVHFLDDRDDIVAAAREAGVDAILFSGWPSAIEALTAG